jgi:hypothetical protein
MRRTETNDLLMILLLYFSKGITAKVSVSEISFLLERFNYGLLGKHKNLFNSTFDSSLLACLTAVHKKCHDKLLGTCSESSFNSESTIVSMTKIFEFA